MANSYTSYTNFDSTMKDIGACKNRIINLLKGSDDIMTCLLGKGYTDEDVDGDDEDDTNNGVMYDKIYPYLYVDETQTITNSYICFEVDCPSIPTHSVKNLRVTFWCFCHKREMSYSFKGYLGTRVDIMADMIDRAVKDSYKFGIGKMECTGNTYTVVGDVYYGRQITYVIPDFKVK